MFSSRLSTGGAVYSLCPTSSCLVVGGRDCLQGWDWASLAQARSPSWEISLPGRGEVNCIAVVADEGCEDRVVVGMGDNNLHLVDLESGTVLRVLSGHSGHLHSVAASAGLVASGGEEGEVRLWDSRQWSPVHSLSPADLPDLARPKLGRHVAAVSLSSDWLAAGGGPAPATWHLKSWTIATPLPSGDNEVKVIKFHENNVMVAGRGRTLQQLSLSGEVKAEVEMSSSVIYSLEMRSEPGVLCCAGSSSYIDVLTSNYNYKHATIQFPLN